MVTWLHCFWAYGEAEHCGGEGMVEQSYSLHGGLEEEKERERERERRSLGQNILFKGMSPVTYFL
jgi:hypothetical protein